MEAQPLKPPDCYSGSRSSRNLLVLKMVMTKRRPQLQALFRNQIDRPTLL
jgi:hypothetical protein